MTVSELIAFLQTQPQDIQVGYQCYSENCLLDMKDILVVELSSHRADGWIHDKRRDTPTQNYLIFPGN